MSENKAFFLPATAAAGVRLTIILLREPRQVAALPAWWRARSATEVPAREPWWPRRARELIASRLPACAEVFEYGGGGSTHWLAGLGATVVTVEHHRGWYDEIKKDLPENATLLLREPNVGGSISSTVEPGTFDEYVAAISEHPDNLFDLVVVDGRARVACGLAAISKVKPGGMLLLDDSQRPRYRPLRQALQGWSRRDVRELKPRAWEVSQTTVWTKTAV